MDSFLQTGQMTMEPPPTIHIIRTVNVTTQYISKKSLMVKEFDQEKRFQNALIRRLVLPIWDYGMGDLGGLGRISVA